MEQRGSALGWALLMLPVASRPGLRSFPTLSEHFASKYVLLPIFSRNDKDLPFLYRAPGEGDTSPWLTAQLACVPSACRSLL